MAYYIAAYDAEAVYPYWEPGGAMTHEGEKIELFPAGVRAVTRVHLELKLPATFFVVAKLLENAGPEPVEILDHPLFDIQCHSYSHANVLQIAEDEVALQRELVDSKRRIEDTFGRPIIGFGLAAGWLHRVLVACR